MRTAQTKHLAKKLGVSTRHAARLKAKGDPRAVRAMEERAKEKTRVEGRMGRIQKKFKFTDRLGIGGTVERLRDLEQALAIEVQRARDTCDPDLENLKTKQWLSVVDKLRHAENDAPDADLAAKNTIPAGEVEDAWMRALIVFRKKLEAMARRVSTNPTIAATDRIALEQLVLDEVGKTLAELVKVEWAKEENKNGKTEQKKI